MGTSLTDPRFNLREILKQLLLVEDHLQHSHKSCPDCIQKHLLMVEGLSEEILTLDNGDQFVSEGENLAGWARRWMAQYLAGYPPMEIAQSIREIRKILCPHVSNPEDVQERLAHVYLQGLCPHRR